MLIELDLIAVTEVMEDTRCRGGEFEGSILGQSGLWLGQASGISRENEPGMVMTGLPE